MDKPKNWAFRMAVALACMLTLSGCQTASKSLQHGHGEMASVDFGATWSTYTACRTSLDLQDVLVKADRMQTLIAHVSQESPGTAANGLMWGMGELFKTNKPRLSADPQLMALDCWLHAGTVAEMKGRDDIAHDMYMKVVRSHHTQENSYYVELAQAGLNNLGVVQQATALRKTSFSSK